MCTELAVLITHTPPTRFCRNGKAKGTKLQVRPTDLSGVVDVASASQLAELGAQVVKQDCPELAASVYSFPAHPGLCQWQLPK